MPSTFPLKTCPSFKHFLLQGLWCASLSLFIAPNAAKANLPLSWSGTFAADTTLIKDYRRTEDLFGNNADGSQYIAPDQGKHKNASFQSYILQLRPSLIINDAVNFYGEVTTGYAGGGQFGDSTLLKKEATPSFGNALYLYSNSSGGSNLSMTQFYAELLSDTATYILGRQPAHWGLGILMNDGKGNWSRHATVRDGLTARLTIGNFQFSPYWAKINSLGSLTKASNTKEYGLTFLYNNIQRDLKFGILFSRRKSDSQNSFFKGTQGNNLGRTKIKIIDLFFEKSFKKFTFSVEAPIISGDLGDVYGNSKNTKYKAYAVVSESEYRLNQRWKLSLQAGRVSGDDGPGADYKALYLHPNYKISRLMFNYNLLAVSDSEQSIYDTYLVNVLYGKLRLDYTIDNWNWHTALLWAKANETAGVGSAYDHLRNRTFTSTRAQEDDYGLEVMGGFKYQWNPNVAISADLAYFFVGDYFAYSNATPTKLKDTFSLSSGLNIQF